MDKLTIPQALVRTYERFADRPGVWIKSDGEYNAFTWKEIYTQVETLPTHSESKAIFISHQSILKELNSFLSKQDAPFPVFLFDGEQSDKNTQLLKDLIREGETLAKDKDLINEMYQ